MRLSAEELETRGDFHVAALYFMAIDEVHRAVETYQKGEHFR